MNMSRKKWDYVMQEEIHRNLIDIALVGIRRIIWECDMLNNDEKVSEIDGIITFLDDIEESIEESDEESMEDKDDD